jgi:hypothetical protein
MRAEKPNRPLAARCRLVRSNNSGESCVEGLLSSVITPGLPSQRSRIAKARFSSQIRSGRRSLSSSPFFFAKSSSNQRAGYMPAATPNSP